MVQPCPDSQYTQQFLSSVLSQRGPTALPYTEDTKWLIRQHLVKLSETFPSLDPKTAAFTHNDGRSVHLLQADGTIPVTFQAVTYNIPIIIWLLDSYPRHPPCVYVNPTRDMIIKRPHPHVNPSGLVSVPYLHNWVYPTSNLVDLVKHLSAAFGRDPPLYSQRRPNNSNPSEGFRVNSVNLGGGLMSNSVNLGNFGRPGVPPPRGYPPQLSHPPYGGRPVTEDPTEVYKRNAVSKIVEMVHGDVGEMRREREGEVEGLFNLQGVLRRRGEEVSKGLREMLEEKEALEQQLQIVLMNGDVLEGWLRDNKGKKLLGGVENVDDVFECVDVLSKQMLECTASDLAIEDTIDSLDKAVQMGVVPFEQYLRSVRALSREQFFQRATASKVRAAQLQAQVANMAARNAHYGR